ncbi:MAG: hypothetical protein CR959_01205 [Fusobacteriales bacterium]|nr:MAG: hypothetical protein CR959_01205 [Fusobacteriales bacterium]
METRIKFTIGFMISITILIGFLNLRSLKEVSNSQKLLKQKMDIYENKKKELDLKNITYDKKYDLREIRKKMEKKGMETVNEIIFFEVGD